LPKTKSPIVEPNTVSSPPSIHTPEGKLAIPLNWELVRDKKTDSDVLSPINLGTPDGSARKTIKYFLPKISDAKMIK
jgi:hypothetical protein